MGIRSQNRVHDIALGPPRRGRGRPKLYAEQIRLPLVAGTKARLDAVCGEDEDRLDLIREAIGDLLRRREQARAAVTVRPRPRRT